MYPKSFRFIAILVLLAVISMFTGLETAFSAAPVVKAEKSCCDGCGHDEDQDSAPSDAPASKSVPHSAPYCPAFMCLYVDVVEPVTLKVISSETVPFFTSIPEQIPDPFIKSIFRPPSLV